MAGISSNEGAAAPKVSAEERLGVPAASFIEEVDSYMEGKVVDEVIGELTARMQKYRLVETQLAQRKATIALKIPEIRKSLETVRLLQERKKDGQVVFLIEETDFDFELSDNVYAKATVKDPPYVCLWLGANVMVEYSFDEALDLLAANLKNAEESLDILKKDIEYIRDNVTVTEVGIARVFNYDVKRRREKAQAQSS